MSILSRANNWTAKGCEKRGAERGRRLFGENFRAAIYLGSVGDYHYVDIFTIGIPDPSNTGWLGAEHYDNDKIRLRIFLTQELPL